MIFSEEYCRNEILAIVERWAKIRAESGGPLSAQPTYRLVIHPDLWDSFRAHELALSKDCGIAELLGSSITTKFLNLLLVITRRIEGWRIVDASEFFDHPHF